MQTEPESNERHEPHPSAASGPPPIDSPAVAATGGTPAVVTPADGAPPTSVQPSPYGQPAPRRPARIWPSLVIIPMTLIAVLAGQVVLGISFAILFSFEEGGVADIQMRILSDVRFLTLSLLVNFSIIAGAAVLGGWLSRERLAQRLMLARPRGPLWNLPLIMLGTLFIWAMVTLLFPLVFKEPSEHLIAVQEMLVNLGRSNPLLLIVLIAVLPAIVEELLTRGYVLRRLSHRLGPVAGITIATLGFALLHMDPQHMLGVIPLGAWCGFVAWRTGSV